MREMVFRERTEKVAHVRAMAAIFARMSNTDVDKAFGGVISDYASEVFQESYDSTLLAEKAQRLKAAQKRIRERLQHDRDLIKRLERMELLGEQFDKQSKSPK